MYNDFVYDKRDIMDSNNLIIILVAFIVAVAAIYVLYSIILFQGGSSKGDDLQLTTKNVLDQVEVLFSKKEYALVELLASKYLDRVPGHTDVRLYLAKAYYEDKKYNQAIKHCEIILKKNNNNIDTHEVMGKCYIRKGWLNKAIQEFELIYEHRSTDKKVVRTLAELYRETEQLFMSISAYNALSDLMELEADMADIQSVIAELCEEVHDFPAAFEAYKRRLSVFPTDVETNKKLAELYIQINNYPVAIETLLFMLSFVEEPKTQLWIYENIIELYVEMGEYQKAIDYAEKMLDIQGSDKFKIRDNIAQLNIKLGNIQEGVLILEDLTLMSQNAYEITLELAKAYIENKEFQKALDKYKLLLDKASPREAKNINLLICELYIAWALDKQKEGLYEESDAMLYNSIQYNPINSEVYYCLAKNRFEQRNYSGAVDQINKALEYGKDSDNCSKYLILLADAHHNIGNFFEEKKALSDLLKHDNKNAEGLLRLGIMYAAQNDIKNAEESFKAALDNNPALIAAKYNLALVYENNNRDRAKELYMEVLTEDPTNEEAKRALADLSASDMY